VPSYWLLLVMPQTKYDMIVFTRALCSECKSNRETLTLKRCAIGGGASSGHYASHALDLCFSGSRTAIRITRCR